MKRNAILFLVALFLLPALTFGCKANYATPTIMPPLDTGGPAIRVDLIQDDFNAQAHIVKDIEVTRPAKLIVSLYSNPTTGFSWGESANITNTSVMEQASHKYVAPQTDVVGAGGKDVWVFDSKQAGNATIDFSYGRPWEGGEKGFWTVTLNVTVK